MNIGNSLFRYFLFYIPMNIYPNKLWLIHPKLFVFVRLFAWRFLSHSRIFHSVGDITIAGGGLQKFDLCSALMVIKSEWGFFSLPHILWQGYPFIMIITDKKIILFFAPLRSQNRLSRLRRTWRRSAKPKLVAIVRYTENGQSQQFSHEKQDQSHRC